jgi:membrane protein CcdC involved in cytochrome C biogenesis
MSDFLNALAIGGSIFAVMMVSQLGRREYSWHKIALPVVSVAAFGWAYLRHLPTTGNAVWLYVVGIAIGAVFAVFATVTTTIERDGDKLFTRTGAAFVVTWLVALALRVGFVWGVDNVPGFRRQVGVFMMDHQLVQNSIAPFFVLIALATVVGRVVAVRIRANRVARSATHEAGRAAVAA